LLYVTDAVLQQTKTTVIPP